jgi:hypothetical protein
VQYRTARWAELQRRPKQTPKLVGDGNRKLALVRLQSGSIEQQSDDDTKKQPWYPLKLKEAWMKRDEWWDNGSYRWAPRTFIQMEAVLLRAEEGWRAGRERVALDRLGEKNREFNTILEHAKSSLPGLGVSIPLRRAAGSKIGEGPVVESARQDLQVNMRTLTPHEKNIKEEDRKKKTAEALCMEHKALGEAVAKLKGEFKEKYKGKLEADDLAALIFDVIADDDRMSKLQFEVLIGLLPPAESRPALIEQLYLDRLVELKKEFIEGYGRDWDPKAIHELLEAVRRAQQALASGPSAWPWIDLAFGKAAAKLHQGEKLFFWGDRPAYESAVEPLRQANAEFGNVARNAEIIAGSYETLDRAFVMLTGSASYFLGPDSKDPSEWHDAVKDATRLLELLSKPREDGAPFEQIKTTSQSLRDRLVNVNETCGDLAAQKLMKQSANDPIGRYDAIQVLLRSPRLRGPAPTPPKGAEESAPAADRVALWTEGHRLALATTEQTLKRVGEYVHPGSRDTAAGAPTDADGVEFKRAERRAQIGIDLLRLGGFADAEKLDDDWKLACRKKDAAAWRALGERLRAAWTKQAPEQLKKEENANNLAAADRMARVLVMPGGGVEGGSSVEPAIRLQGEAAIKYVNWLHQRLKNEAAWFAMQENSGRYREFYEKAAARYQR